jgi:hypothetical protein
VGIKNNFGLKDITVCIGRNPKPNLGTPINNTSSSPIGTLDSGGNSSNSNSAESPSDATKNVDEINSNSLSTVRPNSKVG